MLAAAQVSAQGGEGFLTILLLGLLVVGSACLAAVAIFGRDDDGE